jgi:hypothetical protein
MTVGALCDFRMNVRRNMPLERAHQQPMRAWRPLAVVWNVAAYDVRAEDIAVHQGLRCPKRL